MTQENEEKLLTSERKILRKIQFNFEMVDMEEKNWRSGSVIQQLEYKIIPEGKTLEWAGRVWRAVENITRNILIKIPTKKTTKRKK